MVFKFNKQLEVGQKLERFLAEYAKDELELLDGKNCDFKTKLPINNKFLLIEVKNDESSTAKRYFDEGREPNFFIERYSNLSKLSNGGPFQTKEKNGDIFGYVYGYKQLAYFFHVDKLVERIEALPDKRGHSVRNQGYDTFGYIVPHQNIVDLSIKVDLSIPNQQLIPVFKQLC